jgi:hypothetical protein
MTPDRIEMFRKRVPEVATTFNGLIPLLIASTGIDPEDHP